MRISRRAENLLCKLDGERLALMEPLLQGTAHSRCASGKKGNALHKTGHSRAGSFSGQPSTILCQALIEVFPHGERDQVSYPASPFSI